MNLYQFPISQTPNWNVVMATLPSDEPVPNYGMGLTAYVIGDLLPKRKGNESVRETIERRRARAEFIARGLQSRDDARRTGVYHAAGQVHGEMRRMLAKASKRVRG